MTAEKPSGRLHFGWVVLAAAFYINLILDGYCFVFGIIRLNIEEDYPDYPTWMIAIIGGVIPTIYLIFAPVCLAVNEFLGPTRVIICASLISTVSFILAWLNAFFKAGFVFDMLMLGIFQGVSSALLYGPSICVVTQYFPPNQRALAAGITTCGSSIGAIFYSLIIPPLFEAFGWRGSLAIFAGLSLNVCVCAMPFMQSLKPGYKSPPQISTLQQKQAQDDIPGSSPPPVENSQSSANATPSPPLFTRTISEDETIDLSRPPVDREGVPIPHCYIIQKILEDKLRNRLDTNHSLDNAIITRDNILIRVQQNQLHKSAIAQDVENGAGASVKKKNVPSDNDDAKQQASDNREEMISSAPDVFKPPASFIEVVERYFERKLIFHPSFLLILASGACSITGYYIPTLLVTGQSMNPEYGVSPFIQTNLVLLWGVFNTIGRAFTARMADHGLKHTVLTSFWIFIIGHTVSALILLIFPHFMTSGDIAFISFVLFYGLFISPLITMPIVLLIEMFGRENVNASFGWLLFVQGIVQISGFVLPIWLDTMSATYSYGFGAINFIFSSLFVGLNFKLYFKRRRERTYLQEVAKRKAHLAALKKRHTVY